MRNSTSENNGIALLKDSDLRIYSVGISTAGSAEIRMALLNPKRQIIATTIDQVGALAAQNKIDAAGLSAQIEIRLEDIRSPLPYPEGHFDFIYARLVLHYLSKVDLTKALHELHRILKVGGKLFVVVRSHECLDAKSSNATFDPESGMTHYRSGGNSYSRYFHSEESIQNHLLSSNFSICTLKSYEEQLCTDFERKQPSSQVDLLIETLVTKF